MIKRRLRIRWEYYKENEMKSRVVVPGLLFLVLIAVCSWAFAQNARTMTFPLNKEFFAHAVICLEKKDAVAIMESVSIQDDEKRTEAINNVLKGGKCAPLGIALVYKKLLVRKVINGETCSVYEATVGQERVYVPLRGWQHSDGSI